MTVGCKYTRLHNIRTLISINFAQIGRLCWICWFGDQTLLLLLLWFDSRAFWPQSTWNPRLPIIFAWAFSNFEIFPISVIWFFLDRRFELVMRMGTHVLLSRRRMNECLLFPKGYCLSSHRWTLSNGSNESRPWQYNGPIFHTYVHPVKNMGLPIFKHDQARLCANILLLQITQRATFPSNCLLHKLVLIIEIMYCHNKDPITTINKTKHKYDLVIQVHIVYTFGCTIIRLQPLRRSRCLLFCPVRVSETSLSASQNQSWSFSFPKKRYW